MTIRNIRGTTISSNGLNILLPSLCLIREFADCIMCCLSLTWCTSYAPYSAATNGGSYYPAAAGKAAFRGFHLYSFIYLFLLIKLLPKRQPLSLELRNQPLLRPLLLLPPPRSKFTTPHVPLVLMIKLHHQVCAALNKLALKFHSHCLTFF